MSLSTTTSAAAFGKKVSIWYCFKKRIKNIYESFVKNLANLHIHFNIAMKIHTQNVIRYSKKVSSVYRNSKQNKSTADDFKYDFVRFVNIIKRPK